MPSRRLTFDQVDGRDGRTVVTGEVDAHTVDQLVTWLESARAAGALQVELDLSGIRFVDSAGLQAFVQQTHEFHRHGGRLRLRGVPEGVHRLVRLAALDGQLDITHTSLDG